VPRGTGNWKAPAEGTVDPVSLNFVLSPIGSTAATRFQPLTCVLDPGGLAREGVAEAARVLLDQLEARCESRRRKGRDAERQRQRQQPDGKFSGLH
jgi:hypothetical protein